MYLVKGLALRLVDGHREGEADGELPASEGVAASLRVTGGHVVSMNVHVRSCMWRCQELAFDVLKSNEEIEMVLRLRRVLRLAVWSHCIVLCRCSRS